MSYKNKFCFFRALVLHWHGEIELEKVCNLFAACLQSMEDDDAAP